MQILARREACCFQDDQMGPLEATYEVDDRCRLDDFLEAVERSGFLQFSSTHTTMSCRFADKEVARVFGPSLFVRRKSELMVDRATLARDLAAQGTVDFVFVHGPLAPASRAARSLDRAPGSNAWRAFRVSTYVLLLISSVFSAVALYVGFSFGFNLWRWDRPGVTVAWLAMVLLPLAAYRLVKAPPRSFFALVICAGVLWAPIGALVLGTIFK